VFASRRSSAADATVHTHFLSNGRYTTALTMPAAATAMWGDIAVTRRRDDPTSTPARSSSTCAIPGRPRLVRHAPAGLPCRRTLRGDFDLDKITFRRRDGDFETQLDITVSSEDDVEVRRLTLTNRGATPELEVTSYAEIALARPRTTSRIRRSASCSSSPSSIRRARAAVHAPARARRRIAARGVPRARRRRPRWAARSRWETDRARFLGRGRRRPTRIARRRALSGTTGAVLDPDRRAARAHPAGPARPSRSTFATGVAPDRASALALARKYRDGSALARLLDGVHARTHHRCSTLGLSERGCHPVRSPGVARLRVDNSLQPRRLARNAFGSRTWGTRHLRRPADRAGAVGRQRRCRWRASSERAGVLARQGLRAIRDPQRAPPTT
jgi:cyclic beta-1,2-glucan synthetase